MSIICDHRRYSQDSSSLKSYWTFTKYFKWWKYHRMVRYGVHLANSRGERGYRIGKKLVNASNKRRQRTKWLYPKSNNSRVSAIIRKVYVRKMLCNALWPRTPKWRIDDWQLLRQLVVAYVLVLPVVVGTILTAVCFAVSYVSTNKWSIYVTTYIYRGEITRACSELLLETSVWTEHDTSRCYVHHCVAANLHFVTTLAWRLAETLLR